MVSLRVTSDPPGATLSSLARASVLGTTPLTMRYAVPDQWRNCVSDDGLEAKWPNGLQVEVKAIELCPEGGTDQEIRLALPTRQETRGHPRVPSGPSHSAPSYDALTPMDLSVPDAPKAAPASHSDALTPMDLSMPESAPQAAPAARPDALTPMDSSQLVDSAISRCAGQAIRESAGTGSLHRPSVADSAPAHPSSAATYVFATVSADRLRPLTWVRTLQHRRRVGHRSYQVFCCGCSAQKGSWDPVEDKAPTNGVRRG